jgi:hypothetical protein
VLIDTYAPKSDARELHQIEIAAGAEVVYQSLWSADLGSSVIIKTLMGLRTLPALLLHPRHSEPTYYRRKFTMQALIDFAFGKLGEEPGREIVLGVAGKFWRPTGNVLPFDVRNFIGPVPAGLARGVWNFHVEQVGPRRTVLSTETRVVCGDTASRIKFRTYWLFVRPFSGLIRRLMLKAIKRECDLPQQPFAGNP